jgi:hypothetical protein
LEAQGCNPVIISWLADYLTDRTQSLATNGSCTTPLPVNRGLVQGSGIGPCAFIAYISDLKPCSNATTFCKFADDLTALVRNDAEAEQEMAHIMKWSDHNKLLINLKKPKKSLFAERDRINSLCRILLLISNKLVKFHYLAFILTTTLILTVT